MNGIVIVTDMTPIEVALQVDENGKVSAKNLYEWLELNPTHYARWAKAKIEENEFATESVDFTPFTINGECGGQATKDYKLTATFAKKIAMGTFNERGEQAKEYFICVEDKLRKIAQQSLIHSNEQQSLIQEIVRLEAKFDEYGKALVVAQANTAAYRKAYRNWLKQVNTYKECQKLVRELIMGASNRLTLTEKHQ